MPLQRDLVAWTGRLLFDPSGAMNASITGVRS